MKISRDNPEFDNYDIFVSLEIVEPRGALGYALGMYKKCTKEIKLKNVVEADDETGFVVQQMTDEKGSLIYTNDHDEIAIDNTVKFLMCNQQLRQAFLAAGFRPKLTSRYEKSLRIVRRVGNESERKEVKQVPSFENDRVQFDAI